MGQDQALGRRRRGASADPGGRGAGEAREGEPVPARRRADLSAEPAVRLVRADDLPGWRPLWDGYNAFYGRAGPTALPPAVTAATWAAFLTPGGPMEGLVAADGPDLLGFAHLVFHPSTSAAGPTCYLQDLFTAEASRGRGIGRALIGAAVERARERGAGRLHWMTRRENAPAVRLYEGVARRADVIVYRIDLFPTAAS